MKRRQLALGLLLTLVAVGIVSLLVGIPTGSSPSRGPVIPANTVVLGVPVPDTSPITLGLGAGLGDLLNNGMAAPVRQSGLGLMRFGDASADDYDWMTGCTYGDAGSVRECSGPAGGGGKLDQFLHFAGSVRARPLIVVNGEIDDPQQAARLVAYYWQHCVRVPGGIGPSVCLRPYWEIGDSPATWKHFGVPLSQRQVNDALVITPDQYAALVVTYAAAMRRVEPGIKIVANEWITGATDQSWIGDVSAIDTHYEPLLYGPPAPPPTTGQILSALQNGSAGRPGVDSWLQDLRDGLEQFTETQGKGIIVGEWAIDAYTFAAEPAVYSSYVQAVFAGQMIAHLWQQAQPGGRNPLLAAIEYPITGASQEPFDIATGHPRAAVAVYALVEHHFGAYPVPISVGAGVQQANVAVAAAVGPAGRMTVLLVNANRARAVQVHIQGLPIGPARLWWIVPDARQATGVSMVHCAVLRQDTVTLAPWAIAVVGR